MNINLKKLLCLLLLLAAVSEIFIMVGDPEQFRENQAVPVAGSIGDESVADVSKELQGGKSGTVQPANYAESLIANCVAMTAGINLTDSGSRVWYRILTAGLPWDLSESKNNNEEELIFNYAAGDESSYYWNQKTKIEAPLVAIYSTHSAESYTPYSGQASVSGSRGGVYVASSVVAETLAKQNIGTVVDDTIHDSPNWNKSYSNSLKTASRLLSENPSVKIIIDMHRDGGIPKDKTTVEINGKSAAKIMLVVGSNQRYEHPYWQQNLELAESIGKKMEDMYPGLLRTVKVQNGRYNQHISTHSILVEMGATENTIEEVEYSSVMLANVLAEILKELN